MSLERLLHRTWDRNILFSVLLELTYRCDLDCVFCYNDRRRRDALLPTEGWLRLLEELAGMQVFNVVLSGGEPLAHPDFFRIGGAARELGFVVRLKTNGHGVTEATARRLREEVDPFLVEISLHGATAATHDRQTRVPGSFDRLWLSVRRLRAASLRVRLAVTLTAWNQHELEAVFDLAERLDAQLTFASEVTPRDDGDRAPMALAPPPAAVARLLTLLAQRRRSDDDDPCSGVPADGVRKSCGAGSAGLAVDPFGTVFPCVQWRRPLGSLHQHTLGEIWSTSPALADVRRLAEQAHGHLECLGPEASGSGFCLGLAEQLTGDPMGTYEGFAARWQAQRAEHGVPGRLPVMNAPVAEVR